MPDVYDLIMNKIPVMSAREGWSDEIYTNPSLASKMKVRMFMKLRQDPNLNFNTLTNLIVIGDS